MSKSARNVEECLDCSRVLGSVEIRNCRGPRRRFIYFLPLTNFYLFNDYIDVPKKFVASSNVSLSV